MSMSAKKTDRAAETTNDPRWASVATRDAAADGTFVYSVKTTGVYCRPSCAARPARPENVRFHATGGEAAAAGLPALQAMQARPAVAGGAARGEGYRGMPAHRDAPRAPSLERLARQAGMSAFHFHRVFKAVTGVTPREYAWRTAPAGCARRSTGAER